MKKDTKATIPAELRTLAVQAVKHKAKIDDANFKKKELRETLVRLQEALEARRAEERRIAEEARRREEEAAAEEEARRRAEEERLAAEAEAEESEESEEEEEEPEPEPEPEPAPEADEEESSEEEEEEEDADELMPEPTLRGRVARGMVPFMARAAARPMPPAPRRKARPSISFDPPVVAVTPESESESEEEEPVKVECDEASAEEIESEDEEEPEDEVEEEDAIVEVTRRPARRGYPEPSFEGLEALRAAPKEYHELAASLASAGASIEGGDRPLLDFRRDLITSARVAAVTITVHQAKRDRDIEIDEEGPGRRLLDGVEAHRYPSSRAGDIAAQTAACVREIREATKALNPIKTKLRAFEGMKVSVPGGRVAIGVSVYGRRPASSSNPTRERRGDACSRTGYAIFVDRGVWNKLDEEVQDACVDAGLIKLKGAAAASVALTVRSIGEAPPVPRKRAAPKKSRKPAKKGKLSAVVRAKRGVTYYK